MVQREGQTLLAGISDAILSNVRIISFCTNAPLKCTKVPSSVTAFAFVDTNPQVLALMVMASQASRCLYFVYSFYGFRGWECPTTSYEDWGTIISRFILKIICNKVEFTSSVVTWNVFVSESTVEIYIEWIWSMISC